MGTCSGVGSGVLCGVVGDAGVGERIDCWLAEAGVVSEIEALKGRKRSDAAKKRGGNLLFIKYLTLSYMF